jgi:hypothetical protein
MLSGEVMKTTNIQGDKIPAYIPATLHDWPKKTEKMVGPIIVNNKNGRRPMARSRASSGSTTWGNFPEAFDTDAR